MNNEHTKKMILPIIIAFVVGLYFLSMAVLLVVSSLITKKWWISLFSIIPVILLVILIVVTVQRIKEIKGGQEDDLSKY